MVSEGEAARQAATATPAPASRPEAQATVTCGFCGAEFVEDRSQATCQACPLSKACGLMRCPHCGYENPKQPAWLAKIREWMR